MAKSNGGPAFARPKSPRGEFTDSVVPGAQDGMSLRDYFAAKAVAALEDKAAGDYEWLAANAYKISDALLSERVK